MTWNKDEIDAQTMDKKWFQKGQNDNISDQVVKGEIYSAFSLFNIEYFRLFWEIPQEGKRNIQI